MQSILFIVDNQIIAQHAGCNLSTGRHRMNENIRFVWRPAFEDIERLRGHLFDMVVIDIEWRRYGGDLRDYLFANVIRDTTVVVEL